MCPQSGALPADIGFQCTNEDLCMSLEKIMSGSPLPGNVIEDVNPYQYLPSNLPDGFWFFIHSNEKSPTNLGHWRAKGEATRIFSNCLITGWRSTLEFYQGQPPHEIKTKWMMQENWITHTKSNEEIKLNSKELARSLCRVVLADEEKSTGPEICSTSKPQVSKNNEARTLTVTEVIPDQIDCISRGDFMELLDLDTPASFSFSSVSSCLTMSSDECFDSLALLEELGPPPNDFKFSISAPQKPDELVMFAPSSGSLNKSTSEEGVRRNSSIPGSADRGKITEMASSNASRNEKPHHGSEGPSNSHNVGRTKKLKKKYFCFMPF